MKRLSIFVIILLSVLKGVSQESEEEYEYEEETQSDEDVQEEEADGKSNYLDVYDYFSFTNDEYANALDKVNDLNPEDQNVLFKLVLDVRKDPILKDRLYRELSVKPKKKNPYKGKDKPGFACVLQGLIENQTVYNKIINDGGTEQQARNAAALSERTVRRKCGVTKKVNKDEQQNR